MNKVKNTAQPPQLKTERSLTSESFRAFSAKNVHQHEHFRTPHRHRAELCDRFNSGLDRNRESRFYFTPAKTSVRCYLNYDEKLVPPEIEFETRIPEKKEKTNAKESIGGQVKVKSSGNKPVKPPHKEEKNYNTDKHKDKHDDKNNPSNLNGRKLSPKTLRNKLNISQKFVEDAKELVYTHETLSFTPVGYQAFIQPLPKPVTFADLAVIPIIQEKLSDNSTRQALGSLDMGEVDSSDNFTSLKDKKSTKKGKDNKLVRISSLEATGEEK